MPLKQEKNGQAATPVASPQLLQLHTIGEVCRALRLGRTKVHELINEGRLRRVKIGRATRITNRSLLDYIEQSSRTGGQSNVG